MTAFLPISLSAYVLSRRAGQEELRYIPNVSAASPWLRRPLLRGGHHLPAHSGLQLPASRTEVQHQLCGHLR